MESYDAIFPMDTTLHQPYALLSGTTFASFAPMMPFGQPVTCMPDESIESTSPGSYEGTNFDIQPEEFETYMMLERSMSDLGSSFVDDTHRRITDAAVTPLSLNFSDDTATGGHTHVYVV